jgi:lysophospholipase L1-like esterase
MIPFSKTFQTKRPGTTVAGIFSVALGSVLLLCGAGSVPVQNFLPQGTMQADLNAGGHNVTNAATISAGTLTATNSLNVPTNFFSTNNVVQATGTYSNPSWITALGWSKISGTPTTLSGYGITDPVALTSGSYSNPSWITALGWSKISGTPTTLSGYGITDPVALTSGSYSNPSWITALGWSKISGTPTTLSGYGITDPVALTSGSYSNPSWITALGWSKISGTPTTLSGYGITDAYTKTVADGRYLQSANNLSDVGSQQSALQNIGAAFNQDVAETSNFTVTTAQRGKLFEVTTGTASVTATLPAAATAGNGFAIFVRKADSGTGLVLNSVLSNALAVPGHMTELWTDGTSWYHRDFFGAIDSAGNLSVSTGNNGSINLSPNGTGVVKLGGNSPNTAGGLAQLDTNGLLPINGWTQNLDGQAFVFEGDSITSGSGLSSPSTQNFGYIFSQLPWAKNHGTYYNDGVFGSYLSDVTGRYAANVYPHRPTANGGDGGARSFLFLNILTNELINGSVTFTGNTTSSSTTVSSLSSTKGIYPGLTVTGTGIPGSTTVVSVNVGASTMVLSNAATATGSAVSINGGYAGPELVNALNTYVTQARSDGFTVVLSTIMTVGNVINSQEAIRESINQTMRGTVGTTSGSSTAIVSDLVADYDYLFQDPTSSTWKQGDGVHPSAAAHNVIAFYLDQGMRSGGFTSWADTGKVAGPLNVRGATTMKGQLNANGLALITNASNNTLTPLQVTHGSSASGNSTTSQIIASLMRSGQPSSSTTEIEFGRTASTDDCARLVYYNPGGTASSSNLIGIGTHGRAGALNIYCGSAGDVEAALGNVRISTVGKGLEVKEGSNAKQGTATLTAGTVTVSNTSVTANSRIFLTLQSLGTVTVPKEVAVTARTAGTSFTITSADATDTSVVAYEIYEPAP